MVILYYEMIHNSEAFDKAKLNFLNYQFMVSEKEKTFSSGFEIKRALHFLFFYIDCFPLEKKQQNKCIFKFDIYEFLIASFWIVIFV